MFGSLISFLKAVAEDPSSEHISLALASLDKDALSAQAANAVPILEAQKEPGLPFRHVTREQMEARTKRLEEQYGFCIWSSGEYGTDEDCADRVDSDPDSFLGLSEGVVQEIAMEACWDDLDCLKGELLEAYGASVVAVGTVGHWTGPIQGFKPCTDIRDAFGLLTGDCCTVYLKDGELRMENVHHDGTDTFMIRKFKGDADFDMLDGASHDKILEMTESLLPDMCRYFGWEAGR